MTQDAVIKAIEEKLKGLEAAKLCLWNALVALKRSLDQHSTKPEKLELLKSDWESVLKTVECYKP